MATFSTKDKRPRALGSAVNAALMNTLLQHRHFLLQVEAGVLEKMRPVFEEALAEIKSRMAAGYSGYYANLARDLEGLIDAAVLSAQGKLTETLEGLAPAEYAAAGKILSSTLPAPLALRLLLGPPSLPQLQRMVNSPLGGVNYFDRLRTIRRESIRDVVDALAMSLTLGEGMADATWRIMRVVEQIEYREAHTLARTEIQRVANEANKAVYDANSDMLAGIQWCATLDPATCIECAELDLSVWFYAPRGDERDVADAPSIPLHPRCFIDPQVPIRTPGGWTPLGRLREGDLVLTHQGRFRPVTSVIRTPHYTGRVVTLVTAPRRGPGCGGGYGKITVTEGHPVLVQVSDTERAWRPAESIQKGDRVIVEAQECPVCHAITPGEGTYCSNSCRSHAIATGQWARPKHRTVVMRKNRASMLRQYRSGARDPMACTAAAHVRNRQMLAEGNHPFLLPETCTKGQRALARNHGCSGLERLVAWALRTIGVVDYVPCYPVRTPALDSRGRPRTYHLDFAFPDLHIDIEVDGAAWHGRTAEQTIQDRTRDTMLRALGWSVFRFPEAEIRKDPLAVARTIADLRSNHAGELLFAPCTVVDTRIWTPMRAPMTYNVSVAEDESYVAQGIVTHNCRCVWLPAVKSWSDLGFTDQDLASFPEIKDLDGKLYGGYAYGDWFADQPKSVQVQILGPNRWADWDAGSLLLPSIAAAMPAGRVVGIDPSRMSDLLGMGDGD